MSKEAQPYFIRDFWKCPSVVMSETLIILLAILYKILFTNLGICAHNWIVHD